MSDSVQRVLDAAVLGQARSPRFIQQELSKLHAALRKQGSVIRNTFKDESRQTTAEVEIVYALALEAVAAFSRDRNFHEAIHAEYNLARLENSAGRLSPYSTAYIIPSRYNLLYSVVTAVAAAIAAGSCVILEVET
jgi:hypothetical protein